MYIRHILIHQLHGYEVTVKFVSADGIEIYRLLDHLSILGMKDMNDVAEKLFQIENVVEVTIMTKDGIGRCYLKT